MHKIQFRLRLRPRPHQGSLQRSPRPLAGFKGPISKGWEWEKIRQLEREGREERRWEERKGLGIGKEEKQGVDLETRKR